MRLTYEHVTFAGTLHALVFYSCNLNVDLWSDICMRVCARRHAHGCLIGCDDEKTIECAPFNNVVLCIVLQHALMPQLNYVGNEAWWNHRNVLDLSCS